MVLKLSIRTSASPRREQSGLPSETLTMWFKIDYTYLGFASAAAVPMGSEGDPECILFTLNTYQTMFISDILLYYCRNWSQFSDTQMDRRTAEDGRTDRRGSRNSYLDLHLFIVNIGS